MLLRRIKESILKRPLCYTLAGFLLVYFLCGFFYSNLKLTLSLIGFYFVLVIITVKIILKLCNSPKDPKLLAPIMIVLSISLALILSWLNFDLKFKDLKEKYDGLEADVKITVLKANTMSDNYSSHEVMIREIDGEKCRIKANVVSSYFNAFDDGDTIALPVKISVITDFSNLSEAYGLSHGFMLELSSEDEAGIEILESENIFPYTQMSFIRKKISRIIVRFTEDEGRALSRALVYGDRSDLPYSFTTAFRELGISHMLAISGMHFSIMIGLLAILFSKLCFNKKLSVILLALFVVFYAFIAGFTGSVCRAAIMLIFSYLSFFFGKRSDAVTSLFCSAFIICMFNKYAIYDVGLLLSFFSTLGILTVALPVNEKLRGKSICKIKPIYALLSALNITLSAILFTLPISYFCFGYISYISPITNLIFSVFITLILYLIPFMLLLSPIVPLASIVGKAITYISKITVKLSEDFAESGDYYIRFDYKFCVILLAAVFVLLILMLIFYKDFGLHRELVYIPLLLFVIGCYIGNYIITYPYAHGHSVTYYSEGENDAIILSSGGEALLCDISGGSYTFTKNAIEYAENVCKTEITAYMISDYHYTHIGTVTKLVNYTGIRTFILPKPQERDMDFHNPITRFLYYSGCEIKFYTPGEESIEFGAFSISPSIYPHKTANPASLILIESDIKSIPSYTYFSNVRDLTLINKPFTEKLIESVKSTSYTICGAHGDSEVALSKIEEFLTNGIITESFYSGIKN